MHGHSYRLEVAIRGAVARRKGHRTGMVEDFDVIDRIVRETAIASLDHYTLNDFIDNPTAENIVLWIWDRLARASDGLARTRLVGNAFCLRRLAQTRPRMRRAASWLRSFTASKAKARGPGTPAVFVRLAGCNLSCRFCDTDYAIKEFATIDEIVQRVREAGGDCPMVVLTGGEPLAQQRNARH